MLLVERLGNSTVLHIETSVGPIVLQAARMRNSPSAIRLVCILIASASTFSALTGELFRAQQMAARRVLACKIFVDELPKARCTEAGKMAAVDD